MARSSFLTETVTLADFEARFFGVEGTIKRYLNDRIQLKWHIREAFLMYLFWPLNLLPWGHVAYNWWASIPQEGFYHSLDMLSFCYFGDQYVVPLRAAIAGKRHSGKWFTVPDSLWPYHRNSLRYPLWYLTRLVWPQFVNIRNTWKENR